MVGPTKLYAHSASKGARARTLGSGTSQSGWVSATGAPSRVPMTEPDEQTSTQKYLNLVASRSTLGGKLNLVNNTTDKTQKKMLEVYQGLDKSFYGASVNLHEYFAMRNDNASTITHAGRQLQNSNWIQPEFAVDYGFSVPEALRNRVNRTYLSFVKDCLDEIAPVKNQPIDEYVGTLSKNLRSGQGQIRLSGGDIYRGAFKNDKRHGAGVCQFKSGALYRGEWRDDKPHGIGILFSGMNEIVEGRFDKGQVPNGRVKIML